MHNKTEAERLHFLGMAYVISGIWEGCIMKSFYFGGDGEMIQQGKELAAAG